MEHFKVFNPEHDLALANGDRHFIAPRNIREMACDLSPLMDVIDCGHSLVWGWDSAVTTQLLRKGWAAEELPTESALAALRRCSERKAAHDILYAFRADNPEGPYTGESAVIRTTDDIAPHIARHGHLILKDPLSSSGKGLRHLNFNDNEDGNVNIPSGWQLSSSLIKIEHWANALIKRHGYLTAEPYYHKVQDFAMEFYAVDGECHFIGYSLFMTNHHGRYEGNLLMEDDKIETILCQYVPRSSLHDLLAWIICHGHRIIPEEWDTHRFPLHFGIDMMIVEKEDGAYAVHPCVEINLRLNMGIIAHEVHRRLLVPGVEGTFYITAFPTAEALYSFHSDCKQKFPVIYQGRKIVSGYHPLTPIHSHTKYHAYIVCRRGMHESL